MFLHRLFFCLIEHCYTEVKVCREAYPKQIRYHKIPRRGRKARKQQKRRYNQKPERDEPREGKIEEVKIEEEKRPEEIENKLNSVNRYRRVDVLLRPARSYHEVRGYSHHNIENRPHNGEKPTGRRKRRLLEPLEIIHRPHCDKPRNSADNKRYCNADN